LRNDSLNEQINFYTDNHLLSKAAPKADTLLRSEASTIETFRAFETALISKYLSENPLIQISNTYQSRRAIIKTKEYHTVMHDNMFDTIDCHTVE